MCYVKWWETPKIMLHTKNTPGALAHIWTLVINKNLCSLHSVAKLSFASKDIWD